jgi:hypothetical protein
VALLVASGQANFDLMAEPSLSTVKRLFALSANRCAFPECACYIVEITVSVRPGAPQDILLITNVMSQW